MSFNRPFDFDSSEWVADSLAQNTSSLLSYESTTNQDNWPVGLQESLEASSSSFLFTTTPVTSSLSLTHDFTQTHVGLESDISTAHLLEHAPQKMHLLDTTLYHQAIPHAGSMTMQEHSPQIISEAWKFENNSLSGNQSSSTSSSPSMSDSATAGELSSIYPVEASASSRKRGSAAVSVSDSKSEKRRRNNVAAAKYRQKKIDKIEELEGQLRAMIAERDDLKIALAKRDAEVELLRKMLESRP